MTMSYWEFGSLSIDSIHRLAKAALNGDLSVSPFEALQRIEQICVECDLAFDGEGGRVEDEELREKLEEHYGEPRAISWDQGRVDA